MMKNRLTRFMICVFMLAQVYAMGQEPQFSQFYAAPLYLNPAFTGNTAQFRIAGNYRNQWPQVPGAFISGSFSYDQNISKISSGIGFQVIKDKAGAGGLKFTDIAGLYAYKLSITNRLRLNLGLRAGYTIRGVDFSSLRFGDQYLRDDGTTTETTIQSRISYPDFSSGLALYGYDYWFGISFDHLTSPNQSFTGIKSRLPVKYSLHGGYEKPLKKTVKGESLLSVITAFNYKGQKMWDQLDIGAYLRKEPVIFGIWYRGLPLLKAYQPGYPNNDAITAIVGIQVKNTLHIGYSYDLTISKLTYRSGGAHEIAIIYEFAQSDYKRENRKKTFMIPCAKF